MERPARAGPLQTVREKAHAGSYAIKDASSRAGSILMAWFTAACVKLAFAWGYLSEMSRFFWTELSVRYWEAWAWAVDLLQRNWAWIQHIISKLRSGSNARLS